MKANPFNIIHRALRNQLFLTAGLIARTEFSDSSEATSTLQTICRVIGFLREHSHHEDMQVLPMVAAKDRALAEALNREHAGVELLHREVLQCTSRLDQASAADRDALVPALISAFNRLVSAHLTHMDREEHEVLELLSASYAEEELAHVSTRIQASIARSDWARRARVSQPHRSVARCPDHSARCGRRDPVPCPPESARIRRRWCPLRRPRRARRCGTRPRRPR